jgi:ABC-2 type transport system permease protein
MTLSLTTRCFVALTRKEVSRFVKVWVQTLVSPTVNAVLYLTVFGLSLGGFLQAYPGITYLSFLLPGLVALSCFNNSLQNASSSIMASKFYGDLQDLRLIPLSPLLITFAFQLGCLIRGWVVAGVVLFVGEIYSLISQGQWIVPVHPIYFAMFVSLGALIFGGIGIFAGFITKSFDQLNIITTFVVLPLIYLGGVFFPLSGLSPFWQDVSLFNPLLYLIHGIRWSVLDVHEISIMTCSLVSLIFLVISTSIAWFSVRFGSYQRF